MKSLVLASVSLAALSGSALAATAPDRPMFKVLHHLNGNVHTPGAALPVWTDTWTYSSKNYSAIFVGTDPSKGAVSTTVPVYIFPVSLKFRKLVEDPTKNDATGVSPIGHTIASPVFASSVDYVQGGTDVGKTQYEDAFQRAGLWNVGGSAAGYHVLLGTPTVMPTTSLTVPPADGSKAIDFGVKVIQADIYWFDAAINKVLAAAKLPPDSLPIFVTTDTYLTSQGQCCIGGYHSYTGTQAYSHFTYISKSGAFSQDVSALSHEIGEWVDDPETNNTHVPSLCATHGNGNQIYEVGDPLEVDANYGDYPYTVGGFTYHLQDLTLPPYFGATPSTAVNSWFTFQGHSFTVCQNGG